MYTGLFFVARRWKVEITNREPEKCAELSWSDLSALPENTVPYVEQAIENRSERAFSEFDW